MLGGMGGANLEVLRGMWEPFMGIDLTPIDWEAEREYHWFDGVLRAYTEWLEPFGEYHAEALDSSRMVTTSPSRIASGARAGRAAFPWRSRSPTSTSSRTD